jgi:hypothetical protein
MRRFAPYVLSVILAGAAPALAAPPKGHDWVQTLGAPCEGGELAREWTPMNDTWDGVMSLRQGDNLEAEADGTCLLHVDRVDPARNQGKQWTTAGARSTGFQQTYGYFEYTTTYAAKPGLNQAFWLWSVSNDPQFEIDINEGDYPNKASAALHVIPKKGKKRVWKQALTLDGDASRRETTFGLSWLPSKGGPLLIWYVDGREVARKLCPECTTPARVIFSNAVVSWRKPAADLDDVATEVNDLKVWQVRRLLKQAR